MRLIDVDALCEDLLKRWSIADTRKEELIRAVMADIVTPIIACQPTIEPEQKTGKWISNPRDVTGLAKHCSWCGYTCIGYDSTTGEKFRYCPNCGSYMGGKNDEDD